MNASLLQHLSVITDEEKQLQQNPKNLNHTAYGSVKRLLEVDAARLLQCDWQANRAFCFVGF